MIPILREEEFNLLIGKLSELCTQHIVNADVVRISSGHVDQSLSNALEASI